MIRRGPSDFSGSDAAGTGVPLAFLGVGPEQAKRLSERTIRAQAVVGLMVSSVRIVLCAVRRVVRRRQQYRGPAQRVPSR